MISCVSHFFFVVVVVGFVGKRNIVFGPSTPNVKREIFLCLLRLTFVGMWNVPSLEVTSTSVQVNGNKIRQ